MKAAFDKEDFEECACKKLAFAELGELKLADSILEIWSCHLKFFVFQNRPALSKFNPLCIYSFSLVVSCTGVHGLDWCGLGQIRHQFVTYGLMDLESVTNPWQLKNRSDLIYGGPDWISLIHSIR